MDFIIGFFPILLLAFIGACILVNIVIGAAAVAIGGLALTVLIAIAALAGAVLFGLINTIMLIVKPGAAKETSPGLTIFSLAVSAIVSALIFYYYPSHPISTDKDDVAYISVTDQTGDHLIDDPNYVSLYMDDLNKLRMHRSFVTVTEKDAKDHSALMTLHGAEGEVLETFQMLDDTYFTIVRPRHSESFKAYTILGEVHDYNEFIKVYQDNELSRDMDEKYEQFDTAFTEFAESISADGTRLHFRIPVVEDSDDISVRVTEIYYKEPEEGKINNRAVEKIYEDVPEDYWVEGQDYYLELAGKEYYEVEILFGVGGVAKSYNGLGCMPNELKRNFVLNQNKK